MNYLKSFLLVAVLVSLMSCTSSEKLATESAKKEVISDTKANKKNKAIDKEVIIHYSETYGSECCPRDPKHDNPIKKYIQGFEKQNNVQIDTYYVVQGREGEATYYVNLDNLNEKQKYRFIMGRANIDFAAADKILKAAYPLFKRIPEDTKVQRM